jgi:hypothetical protein
VNNSGKRIFNGSSPLLQLLYRVAKLKFIATVGLSKPDVAHAGHNLKGKASMGSGGFRVKFPFKPRPKFLKWRNYFGPNALGLPPMFKSKEYKPKTNLLGLGVKDSNFAQPSGHSAGHRDKAGLESCKWPQSCAKGSLARCSDPFGKINAGGPLHCDLVLIELFAFVGRSNFIDGPSQCSPRKRWLCLVLESCVWLWSLYCYLFFLSMVLPKTCKQLCPFPAC